MDLEIFQCGFIDYCLGQGKKELTLDLSRFKVCLKSSWETRKLEKFTSRREHWLSDTVRNSVQSLFKVLLGD